MRTNISGFRSPYRKTAGIFLNSGSGDSSGNRGKGPIRSLNPTRVCCAAGGVYSIYILTTEFIDAYLADIFQMKFVARYNLSQI